MASESKEKFTSVYRLPKALGDAWTKALGETGTPASKALQRFVAWFVAQDRQMRSAFLSGDFAIVTLPASADDVWEIWRQCSDQDEAIDLINDWDAREPEDKGKAGKSNIQPIHNLPKIVKDGIDGGLKDVDKPDDPMPVEPKPTKRKRG